MAWEALLANTKSWHIQCQLEDGSYQSLPQEWYDAMAANPDVGGASLWLKVPSQIGEKPVCNIVLQHDLKQCKTADGLAEIAFTATRISRPWWWSR